MEQKELLDFSRALDSAQESMQPYAIVQDDQITVAGDVNDTKVDKLEYRIKFKIPVTDDKGGLLYTDTGIPKYEYRERVYRNIFVTPRNEMRVVKMIAQLYPYLRKILPDGEVKDLSNEELLEIAGNLPDEMIDTMYSLAAAVLGVPSDLKDYMMAGDVIEAVTQIIKHNPSAVNEADSFFA